MRYMFWIICPIHLDVTKFRVLECKRKDCNSSSNICCPGIYLQQTYNSQCWRLERYIIRYHKESSRDVIAFLLAIFII
jgi:hypothetical protein